MGFINSLADFCVLLVAEDKKIEKNIVYTQIMCLDSYLFGISDSEMPSSLFKLDRLLGESKLKLKLFRVVKY